MAVIQTPSIFDFLGQGFGDVSRIAQNRMDTSNANDIRDQEQTRRDAQFLASMVQSGAIDSDTANNMDAAKNLGLHFQPSAAELRRKILASPGGVTTKAGGMDDSGQVSSPATTTPWSPDQRAVAGLPSAAQTSGDALQAQINDIKTRYAKDPKSISDQEARLAGVPTATDTAMSERVKLDQSLQTPAQNYVAQAVTSTKIDPSTPEGLRQLRRQSASLTNAAYNQYVADAKASGDTTALDPKNQGYIKTFFAKEVEAQISKAEDQVIRTKALTPQKTEMTNIDWYRQMKETADDYDKEVAAALKDPFMQAALQSKNPNPAQQAMVADYHKKEAMVAAYRKAGRAFMVPGVDSGVVQKALAKELDNLSTQTTQTTPPSAGGPGAAPAKPAATPNIQAMAQAIKAGQPINGQVPTLAHAKALVDAGQLSNDDYNTLVKMVGGKP